MKSNVVKKMKPREARSVAETFTFAKKTGLQRRFNSNPEETFSLWKGSKERWLFIAPHDDDIVIGAGLILQWALKKNIPLCMLITTDGQMGYCDISERDSIKAERKLETIRSFAEVGVPKENIVCLDFPDCNLSPFRGRSRAKVGDPCVVEDHTGLQNAYVHFFRQHRPTRLFLPTAADLHPDHQIVSKEALISVFHACGEIWPELGQRLDAPPVVYEYAVYCPFEVEPNIQLQVSPDAFQKKLNSIAAYKSQKQIEAVIHNVEVGGAQEYFLERSFTLYSAKNYEYLFAAPERASVTNIKRKKRPALTKVKLTSRKR